LPHWPSGRSSPPGSAPSGSAIWSSSSPPRTSSNRAIRGGSAGPYPEAADIYRERSPNNFPDAFSSPVLILQGLDDRVVPPAHAESIVAALARKGIPYAYLAFEGEGHGFRGAFALRRTYEAQLSFLGQVFGFQPADAIEPLEMPGLEAWRASHPRPVTVPIVTAVPATAEA